jgi:hypothetical protein
VKKSSLADTINLGLARGRDKRKQYLVQSSAFTIDSFSGMVQIFFRRKKAENIMARISTDSFLAFCHSLEGQEILTRAGRSKFTVCLAGDGVEYAPLSTKKPRLHERKIIDSVLDHFEKTGSFITSDYRDLTYNSSYTLTIIDWYLKNHPA